MLSRIGSIIKSPAFESPPKRIIASGLEKEIKSANDSPNILPVNANISLAISSPSIAASNTSFDVISSTGVFLRTDLASGLFSNISLAVRAMPVADAYASRQPFLPHPHGRPSSRLTII